MKRSYCETDSGGRVSQNIFNSFARVMSIKKDWKEEQAYFEEYLKRYNDQKKLQLMTDYM